MDLTELIIANRGPLADPLIAAAGTDISHWFSLSSLPDGNKSRAGGASDSSKSGAGVSSTKAAKESGGDNSVTGRPDECEKVGDPRTFVDPHTGLTVPYLPMGRWVDWRADGLHARPQHVLCHKNLQLWLNHGRLAVQDTTGVCNSCCAGYSIVGGLLNDALGTA